MVKKGLLNKEQRQQLVDDFKGGFARKVIPVNSEPYVERRMTVYGVNIVALRQFARLEDGLNPVVRRLLWTMGHDHDLRPDKRFVKVPEFLGHTSKYHPHGDIGNTFDCLARPWESNVPLLDIRGNKGSESGEDPAAPRYLDAKLSEYAWDCFFSEFDKDIAEMTDNYIRSDIEPVYFPAKYPHFLLNTSSGIGWGFASYYPPFNLIESFRLVQALIENPNMNNVYLFPDSPRGYNIIDDGTAIDVCNKGVGTFKTEANIEYAEDEHALYITGFPEKVMFEKVMVKISKLAEKNKISGIANMADTSTLDISSFMIELKKDANPYQVIDELLSNDTDLKDSTSLALYFAERTSITPYPYSLKGACLEWIRRRIVDKQKYYVKKLSKEQRRKRALEGVVPILSNYTALNKAQKIIMNGETAEDIISGLKDEFPLTSSQCAMLMDMKYSDSAKTRIAIMEKEIASLTESITTERRLVVSHDTIKDVIYRDLEYAIQKYGKPRMCPIIKSENRERPELFYRIVVTQKFIKKLSVGSKASGVGSVDDSVIAVFPNVSENDKIMIVDDLGKVYTAQIKKLLPCDVSNKGTDLTSEVGLKGTVVRAIQINTELVDKKDDVVIAMFTSTGIIKASPLSQYLTNKVEIQGILIDDNDKICWAHVYDKNDSKVQQLVYTTNGFGISFNISNIKIQDRLTKGTTCLKLDDGDSVQGGVQVSLDDKVLVVTNRGCMKICELASIFEASKRKQNMLRITSLDDKDSVFKIIPISDSFSSVTAYLKSGEKIKLTGADIPKSPRLAKCKKLVPVKLGDHIYKVIIK